MCARWPTIAMSKLYFWVWTKLLPLHGCDVMCFGVMCLWFDLLSSDVATCEVICGTTPELLCTTKNYNVLLQYYSNGLLRTTTYYSSTTLYYKVLRQYYNVLPSTTLYYKELRQYYKVLLRYYKVLRQYYSALYTPVLLCTNTTTYYASTTLYYKELLQYYKVLLCTTKYYNVLLQYYSVLQSTTSVLRQYYNVLPSTALYYKELRQYYKVLLRYYKVLRQYYSVLQSTTPVLLCTTKYYASTTKYYASTTTYYSGTTLKRHLQCAEQQEAPSNFTKYCACPAKWIASLILITYETSFPLCGANNVTLHPHQILHLPRLHECHQWSASHMNHHCQCAQQAKSTWNLTKYCACHAKWMSSMICVTYATSFPMRGAK